MADLVKRAEETARVCAWLVLDENGRGHFENEAIIRAVLLRFGAEVLDSVAPPSVASPADLLDCGKAVLVTRDELRAAAEGR